MRGIRERDEGAGAGERLPRDSQGCCPGGNGAFEQGNLDLRRYINAFIIYYHCQ